MNAELEALLKAYDAFRQAPKSEASRLYALYESKLEDAAIQCNVNKDTLHRAIQKKYRPWVRANTPPQSSLPPKA